MAEWQVGFHIVPRSAITAATGRLTPESLSATDWWAGVKLIPGFRDRIAGAGPGPVGTAADTESWGPADGNRVDVTTAEGRISRVIAWADMRRLDSRFAAILLDLARASNAVLVRRDGLVVEPTINAFAGAVRGSSAWRFANDVGTMLAGADGDEDAG